MPMAIEKAKEKLSQQLEALRSDPKVAAFKHGIFRVWAFETAQVLGDIYGPASDELGVFQSLARGLPLPVNMLTPGYQEADFKGVFEDRKKEISALLEGFVHRLDEGIAPEYKEAVVNEERPPRMFIAHGGRHATLDRMLRFLRALGIEPIVVEDQPSLDMTIEQKVDYYLGLCDCALVLATADDAVGTSQQPRGNVLVEAGRVQERFPGKTIWLLEEGASLPTNISAKVWERFAADDLEKAFIYVGEEIRAMRSPKFAQTMPGSD